MKLVNANSDGGLGGLLTVLLFMSCAPCLRPERMVCCNLLSGLRCL